MDRGGTFMTRVTHRQIFHALERWAPKEFAYDWDNVGLQVGSVTEETTGVLVTLDVTEDIVKEAIEHKANVIIAHHPMLFKPIKQIDFNTVQGALLKQLIENDITVYASHTNLDIAQGGVNDLLSEAIGLEDIKPLVPTYHESLVKLAVFTPISHVKHVVDSLSDAGAGHIGNYSHCTFQSEGTGTFKPLEGANPFIGSENKLERVEEIKIETIVEEKNIATVVAKMKEAHPYEEVAYDIYPLKNQGDEYGLGRIGTLKEPMTLQQFMHIVKERYNVSHLRFVGDRYREVKRVAVLGGSGERYIDVAIRAGADVFITGDVTFHPAQEAELKGLAIVDPGHHIEQIMKEATKRYLEKQFSNVKVVASKISTEPFQFL